MRRGTRTAALVAAALAGTVALTGCGSDRDRPAGLGLGIPADGGEQDEKDAGGDGDDARDASGGEGNGVAELPPEEIISLAMEAVNDAQSLRLSGTIDERGGDQMEIDMLMEVGGDCAGSMSVQGSGSFEILKQGDKVWYKPDALFWETFAGPGLAQLEGMYIHGTVEDPELAPIAEMCGFQTFLTAGFEDLDEIRPGEIVKGEQSTHLDVPVIALEEPSRPGQSRQSTLLVATEGEPYLMQMAVTEAGETTELSLSDFDSPVEIDVPPARLVIDANELREGGGAGAF